MAIQKKQSGLRIFWIILQVIVIGILMLLVFSLLYRWITSAAAQFKPNF